MNYLAMSVYLVLHIISINNITFILRTKNKLYCYKTGTKVDKGKKVMPKFK